MNRQKQTGYLLEVPLILMLAGIFLAIFLPMFPVIFKKIVLVIGALVWIAGLFYMIVTPGWQPYGTPRLRYPWSLLVFILVALVIAFITGAYVVYG